MIAADHLIVFTRYPEPGQTKTRMIPQLGAAGAARLQRQLTRHTLTHVQQWQRQSPKNRVTVQFSGGTEAKMQQWLGNRLELQPQVGEGLGDRLAQAAQSSFGGGTARLALIGTDCPGLDATTLQQAFAALHTADVVLGPALDGGYYLIGLRFWVPELFVGIDWGSDRVFQQTLAIAQSLGLTVATLPPLADIDRPEDLPIWQAVRRPTVSVILPVLNEAHRIESQLRELQDRASQGPVPSAIELEILVVDGGSQDETVAIAQTLGVSVLQTVPGRAHQMNRGAALASGEILLFLHADTHLPLQFLPQIEQTLAQPGVVAGAFELQIDGNLPGLRLVEWGVKWRSRLLQLPYGDQGLFLTAETFGAIGGFPELPIMEDFLLVQALRKRGRVAIAPASVLTSARRWDKLGVWRTTLINQTIILGYYLGISPERLAHWYRRDR